MTGGGPVMSGTRGVSDAAAACLSAEDYPRAAEFLRPALAADPHNAHLLVQYAQACLGLRDYGAAAPAAWAARAAAPKSEHAMRLYTLALEGQRRLPEALSMAWQTVSAHPHSPLAHHTYAGVLHESGHEGEALAVVNEALRLDPASTDAMVLRGDIYRSTWGASAAEAQYLEALRLEPAHSLAMHNLAVSQLRWGTFTQAVRGLLAAGRLNPELAPMVHDNIGVALIRVLRMATTSVVFLVVALIVVIAAHDDSLPTVIPRIAAAVLGLAPGGAIVWVLRTVPWPTLLAVLRQRFLLTVRMSFVILAVIVGVVTAAVGSNPVSIVATSLLLLGVPCLALLGWVVKE